MTKINQQSHFKGNISVDKVVIDYHEPVLALWPYLIALTAYFFCWSYSKILCEP